MRIIRHNYNTQKRICQGKKCIGSQRKTTALIFRAVVDLNYYYIPAVASVSLLTCTSSAAWNSANAALSLPIDA